MIYMDGRVVRYAVGSELSTQQRDGYAGARTGRLKEVLYCLMNVHVGNLILMCAARNAFPHQDAVQKRE